MVYKCRSCQYKEARGFMPRVSCGLLLLPQLSLMAVLMVVLIPKGFISSLGAWQWIAFPVLPAIAFLGVIILNLALETIEWLAFCRRPCPQCGGKRWSWGYLEGFGL